MPTVQRSWAQARRTCCPTAKPNGEAEVRARRRWILQSYGLMTLSHEQVDQIKHYAEDTWPFEACGIIGCGGQIIAAPNVARDRTNAFLITGKTFHELKAMYGCDGIWHSHINRPPVPSAADLEQLSIYGVSYIIVGVYRGVARHVRAYIAETQPRKHLRFAPELLP